MAAVSVNANMIQVDALAANLSGIGARLRPVLRATISKGALNIKNDAKARILAQSRHLYVKQYPNSITYDLKALGTTVSAEIGPDKNKPQGDLGNILEFGAPGHNAPMPHLIPAFSAEIPNTEVWLAKAAEDAVLGI